jgi:hypothetical protein
MGICKTLMNATMARVIADEIDYLLYRENDEFHKFDQYSLTPVREANFKNGVKKLPPAYKETVPLKSVLESGLYVTEIPVMKVKGDTVEPIGPFAVNDKYIDVEMPNSGKVYRLDAKKLKQVLSRYIVKQYTDEVNGWDVLYVFIALDRKLV